MRKASRAGITLRDISALRVIPEPNAQGFTCGNYSSRHICSTSHFSHTGVISPISEIPLRKRLRMWRNYSPKHYALRVIRNPNAQGFACGNYSSRHICSTSQNEIFRVHNGTQFGTSNSKPAVNRQPGYRRGDS